MHRKKLIIKLAKPAIVIALISIVVLSFQGLVRRNEFESHKKVFKKYYEQFANSNINSLLALSKDISSSFTKTNSLENISSSINSSTYNNKVINSIQSKYFVDHQKYDAAKKYLWMSDINGNFLFGIPKDDFIQLNEAYDKYLDVIKSDEFYRNRNEFLTKLIDRTKEIDFSQFTNNERVDRYYRDNRWRFYEDEAGYEYMQPTSTTFTTPVFDKANNLIGNLYLKVDDRINERYYFNEEGLTRDDLYSTLNKIFGPLLALSMIFLWFLLPTWVYTDATERDMRNPGIWAFLTLISVVFGWTIYLITRPTHYKSLNCPQCNGELNGTRAYCPHCGTDLSANFCQQCHYPIQPEWQFCPNCRTETKKKLEMDKK